MGQHRWFAGVPVRLAGRLLVVATLWLLWPGTSANVAAATLAIFLAFGCAVTAWSRGEPFRNPTVNRWFEAVVLLMVAMLALNLA